MNVAGLLIILFTSICAVRNYNSIITAVTHFKDLGFAMPFSILCDNKDALEAFDKVY